MSALGDARAEIAAAFAGIVYESRAVPVFAYEPERGKATAPYISVWHSGDPDLDHHGFEVRVYVDPAASLQQAQVDLEELIELVEDKIPGWFGMESHDVGFAERNGLMLASWPLLPIRKVRHR